MGASYSVDEIIGKTLTAKVKVGYYTTATDSSSPVGYIAAGQPVGVVYSYLMPNPAYDRSGLWWAFKGSTGNFYYVKHQLDVFDVDSLQAQGALTELEKSQAAADENLPWYEKLIKGYGVPLAIGGGVIYLLAKFGTAYISRPSK